MKSITYITPSFAVTDMPSPEDFGRFAALGFKSVIGNRPDNEEEGQITGREEAVLAWRDGLRFRHIPAAKHGLFTDAVVEPMADALNALEGPVIAHCKTGLRSAIVWAAASARSQPVDCVLAALRKAGFDLDFLRDDLEAQADRKRWLGSSPALDCRQSALLPDDPGQRAAA
ncbi:MAG: TIGR01244 family phosphatase [Hyphomicrobiaceae bacterium]|nr:TIGR01244 family phosphatase [Hyphomicrobiaceae bacterium]